MEDSSPKSGEMKEEQQTHKLERTHQCGKCNFRTTTQLLLNQHRLLHLYKNRFQCSKCSHSFGEKTAFKLHLKTHRPKMGQPTKVKVKRMRKLIRRAKIIGNYHQHRHSNPQGPESRAEEQTVDLNPKLSHWGQHGQYGYLTKECLASQLESGQVEATDFEIDATWVSADTGRVGGGEEGDFPDNFEFTVTLLPPSEDRGEGERDSENENQGEAAEEICKTADVSKDELTSGTSDSTDFVVTSDCDSSGDTSSSHRHGSGDDDDDDRETETDREYEESSSDIEVDLDMKGLDPLSDPDHTPKDGSRACQIS